MNKTLAASDNITLRSLATEIKPSGWLKFSESARIQPGDLFDSYRSAVGLEQHNEMVEQKVWGDAQGYFHKKYQQFYKGIIVEGCEFSEHGINNSVEYAHGRILEGLELDVTPTISEEDALKLAMDAVGASIYMWEDQEAEDSLKAELGDPNATYKPDGNLVISDGYANNSSVDNYKLVWKFRLECLEPFKNVLVLIDAHTGNVFYSGSSGWGNGPASTLYNGTRTIDTEWKGTLGKHQLLATDGDHNFETRKIGKNKDKKVRDKNDVWDEDDKRIFASAHWAAEMAWDYFSSVHGISGIRDENHGPSRLRIRVADVDFDEFSTHFGYRGKWGAPYILVETREGLTSDGTLDVIGHEFTHGIINDWAGLENANEPGALAESFGDIFGCMIERFVTGNYDWLHGAETGGTFRSLSNPPSVPLGSSPSDWPNTNGCADGYMDSSWYPGTGDAGGIHINCGVQNKWFSLLVDGGTHNGVTVAGIGVAKAERIVFYNLKNFMQSKSKYIDARNGSVIAARILFGECSFEEQQVKDAWAACLVGTPNNCGNCIADVPVINITENTTWDNNTDFSPGGIYGQIWIKAGATLTINTPIIFGITGEIFIESGGKLELNSTLTSCDRWQGVRIFGNTTDGMGVFIGNPGAVIEHAVWGISTTAWGNYLGPSSITCDRVTFRNNAVAAMIATRNGVSPMVSMPSTADFMDCNFINDNNLRHQKFWAFITTYNTTGTRVFGGLFNDLQTNSTFGNPYNGGIIALNGSVDVGPSSRRRSSFNNLYYGIEAKREFGSNHQFDVNDTDFNNCRIGILNSSISGSNIVRNTFNLDRPANGANGPVGILLEDNINGMTVQDNSFISDWHTDNYSVGSFVNNIGTYGNVIRRNTYTGVTYSNVAHGDNANEFNGLYYLCNTNKKTTLDFSSSLGFSVREIQGKAIADEVILPTENRFSYNLDWLNQFTNPTIEYYYDKSISSHKPKVYTNMNIHPADPSNHCADAARPGILTPVEESLNEQSYLQYWESYEKVKKEFGDAKNSGSSELMKEKRRLLTFESDRLQETVFRGYQYALETNQGRDAIRLWLRRFRNMTGDYLLVDDLFRNGEYEQGLDVLSRFNQKYELSESQMIDLEKVTYIYETIAGNKGIEHLDESTLRDLDVIAKSKKGKSCFLARTILRNYGKMYAPIIILPKDEGAHDANGVNNDEISQTKMSVSPNPTDYYVFFDWQEFFTPNKVVKIEITNESGDLIEVLEPAIGSSSLEWTTEHVKGSICFYRLLLDGLEMDSGQIIINK